MPRNGRRRNRKSAIVESQRLSYARIMREEKEDFKVGISIEVCCGHLEKLAPYLAIHKLHYDVRSGGRYEGSVPTSNPCVKTHGRSPRIQPFLAHWYVDSGLRPVAAVGCAELFLGGESKFHP
jgi:hypothetical protein